MFLVREPEPSVWANFTSPAGLVKFLGAREEPARPDARPPERLKPEFYTGKAVGGRTKCVKLETKYSRVAVFEYSR